MDRTATSLHRMGRTTDDLAVLLERHPDAALGRRPAAGAWAATEIVCHLRDVEEFYLGRIQIILANDEPRLLLLDPDRWAEERQYLRNDARQALAAFGRRRRETLEFLGRLDPALWDRGGLHPIRGRITARNVVHGMARHDEVHLDQLTRALAGEP